MFEEEEWVQKFVIATGMILLFFLIVPIILVQGYMVESIHRVGQDKRPVLPTWDNWSQYLSDGLKTFGAQIIYSIPLTLLYCVMMAPFIFLSEEGGELTGALAVLLLCCFFPLM